MPRQVFRVNCLAFLLTLSFASCRAQTLSNCRPTPPLPPNAKPGVGGLSLTRDGRTLVVNEIPADLLDRAKEYRGKMVDAVAEFDEQTMDKYLSGQPITEEEIRRAIRAGVMALVKAANPTPAGAQPPTPCSEMQPPVPFAWLRRPVFALRLKIAIALLREVAT